MKWVLSIILAVISSVASAEYKDWDQWDKEMFWTTTAMMAVDHLTTRDMASRYDEGYTEDWNSWMLGERPDKDTVDLFFLVNYITHYYITDYIQHDEHRAWYLTARFVISGGAAVNNLTLGLGLRF